MDDQVAVKVIRHIHHEDAHTPGIDDKIKKPNAFLKARIYHETNFQKIQRH